MYLANKSLDDVLLAALMLQVFQLISYLPVFDSIPILRNIAVSVFLLICPGIIMLKILTLHNIDFPTSIFISICCSIAFIMFFGLAVNTLIPFFGILEPLSFQILSISMNIVVFIMLFFAFKKNDDHNNSSVKQMSLRLPQIFILCLLASILVSGLVGVLMVDAGQSNLVFILTLCLMAVVVVFMSLPFKSFPENLYPIALWVISLTLLLQASLVSSHIFGWDINAGYFVANKTIANLHWPSMGFTFLETTKINAMLSVNILPSFYNQLAGLSIDSIFKIIFPLIFSTISLGLYKFFRTQWSSKISFLSVFFFISYGTFFTEMVTLERQMIAEVLLVSLLLVIFTLRKNNDLNALFYCLLFASAVVVSHYAIAYIVFLIFVIVTIYGYVFNKKLKSFNLVSLLVYSIVMFVWYMYMSNAGAFDDFVRMAKNTVSNFSSQMFDVAARGSSTVKAMGVSGSSSFWHSIGVLIFDFTALLIVIGFIAFVRKKKLLPSKTYDVFVYSSFIILILSLALPNFASNLRVDRMYHVLLIVLAPLCIFGGFKILSIINRPRALKHLLKNKYFGFVFCVLVLVPFFFFQTELVYLVTGSNVYTFAFAKSRNDAQTLYTLGFFADRDISGATWFSHYRNENTPVYSDDLALGGILGSYGQLLPSETPNYPISNATIFEPVSIVYLTGLFNEYKTFIGYSTEQNITQISEKVGDLSQVYSNGYCTIEVTIP